MNTLDTGLRLSVLCGCHLQQAARPPEIADLAISGVHFLLLAILSLCLSDNFRLSQTDDLLIFFRIRQFADFFSVLTISSAHFHFLGLSSQTFPNFFLVF